MRQVAFVFVISVPAVALSFSSATARVLENWPYKRLFNESDLIVIATAVKVENSGDSFTHDSWPLEFAGVNTTFGIKHLVKGNAPSDTIKVLHYRFGNPRKINGKVPEMVQIIDGPLFVGFRKKATPIKVAADKVVLPQPAYMLFLRKHKDGRFEPVSGKIDPQLSVREVFEPLPEELGGVRRSE